MRNDRVGIFVTNQDEAIEHYDRLTADHDNYAGGKSQMIVCTTCTDYKIFIAEDVDKYRGLEFDSVQITKYVESKYFAGIMARCR